MDHGHALIILNHADLQRFADRGRPDEHCDCRMVGFECSPVMSKCVEHVIVCDAVLAGCGLDVHSHSVRSSEEIVNIC